MLLFPLYLDAQYDWSQKIDVKNESGINTPLSEYSPAYWKDYIVYVGTNPNATEFIQDGHFDLFFTAAEKAGLKKSAMLSKVLNTDLHEGPVCFSLNGLNIMLTMLELERIDTSGQERAVLKIYESSMINDEWQKPQASTLNLPQIPSCHPTLNNRGDLVVFASDRPEGFGKMDLYYAVKQDGVWSEAKNLGPKVNSEHNEWFPFIHENNCLFFASETDSRGLDIFKSKINGKEFEQAMRLPEPINSEHDDFGLVATLNASVGYFSSSRLGGTGGDDIYSFESERSLISYSEDDQIYLGIEVVDEASNEAIPHVTIKIKNISNDDLGSFDKSIFEFKQDETTKQFFSDQQGLAEIPLYDEYTLLEVSTSDHNPWSKVISNEGAYNAIKIQLTEKEEEVSESPSFINDKPVTIGSVFIFENIYYDYNSFEIKRGAAVELDGLVDYMLANPAVKIELRAHTDSRGLSEYNQDLSNKRAQSAKRYLTRNGIKANRISAKGLGESQLRNHCKDGVECSEAEHIYNRRTEVIIIAK